MKKIIYQKQYPSVDDIVSEIQQPAKVIPFLSFDAFMEKANDVQLEPMPEREAMSQTFINTAIQVSDLFQIDLTVEQNEEYISAVFTVESGPCPEALKPLFVLADRYFFTVCKDYRLMISLDFYTHKVFRNGRLIAPISWEDTV